MQSVMEMPDKTTLLIQTDGSGRHHPRTGGYAYRFIYWDKEDQLQIGDFEPQGFRTATSNEMELYACIEALEKAWRFPHLSVIRNIKIFTDSQYVAKHYWYAKNVWCKTQWRKPDGSPVKNAPLWKKLLTLTGRFYYKRIFINIHYERGKTNAHNKAVDKMAKRSSDAPRKEHFSTVTVRRKKFKNAGAFARQQLSGQTLSIRVVTDRWHSIQKTYEYKCEIITKKHSLHKHCGTLFGKMLLKAGHHYQIKISGEEGANIETVLREHAKRTRSASSEVA